jgi:gas vesicle protein
MYHLKSNDTGKVIGALLIGTVFGATLGVLFAPDKGSGTRSKLFKRTKDLAGNIKDNVKSNVKDKVKEEVIPVNQSE